MTTTATRRLTFCAGHRVLGHESKCSNLHGHNYIVEVTAEMNPSNGAAVDDIGRVIDFSVLKECVGGWLERHWDHGFIVNTLDATVLRALDAVECVNAAGTPIGGGDGKCRGTKRFIARFNPTAENMASYLLHIVCPEVLHGTYVRVSHIRLYETENCWADVSL